MELQGASVFNTAWVDQLTADINSVDACAALQRLVNLAMQTIQAEINAIEAQIAALLPVITIPGANLSAIVNWIANFVNPLIVAYETYVAQLAQALAAVARLTAAIQAAEKRLTQCSITIPPVGVAPGVGIPTGTVTVGH